MRNRNLGTMVHEYLASNPPATVNVIAEQIQASPDSVRQRLHMDHVSGKVSKTIVFTGGKRKIVWSKK